MRIVLPVKTTYFLIYALFILWALFLLYLRQFAPSGFFITNALFFFILTPGFALGQFYATKVTDQFDRFIINLISGLAFNFLIFFLSLFLRLNINQVVIANVVAMALLFFSSASYVLLKAEKKPVEMNFSWPKDNQFWFNLLPFFLIIGLIAILSQVGAEFTGDPLYHLALWRKIFAGSTLTPENLAYVQGQINPLYAYPIWHIFMVFLAKIVRTDIFSFWMEIQIGLSVITCLVWFWLLRQFFPNKKLAVFAFVLFIAFVMLRFMLAGKAYLFRRLPIPDTIEQMMFLPLITGVGLKYIFEENRNRLWLIMAIILAFFMAVIHMIQPIYFWMIFSIFGLAFAVIFFREQDYKEKLSRFATLILSTAGITLPYLLLLQLGNGVVGSTASAFLGYHTNEPLKFKKFVDFRVLTKYAYLAAPIVLIFIRRWRPLFLLGLAFAIVPIVYFTPINYYLIRLISHSAVNRIYSDFEWSFAIWALILGFILLLIDRLLARLPKIVKYIYTGVLFFGAIWLILVQWQTNLISYTFTKFFKDLTLKVDQYHWQIFIIILVLALAIFVWQIFNRKVSDFFAFSDFQNNLPAWLGIFILSLLLLAPSFIHFKNKTIAEISGDHHFFQKASNPQDKLINLEELGGQDMIDAINQKVSSKSIFDTNAPNNGFEKLPMLVDQHMSNYWSLAALEYSKVYDEKFPITDRLGCLNLGKIDYLLVSTPDQKPLYFDQYSEYFTKFYQNDRARIYRVNQTLIQQNYPAPVANWDDHICRSKKPR